MRTAEQRLERQAQVEPTSPRARPNSRSATQAEQAVAAALAEAEAEAERGRGGRARRRGRSLALATPSWPRRRTPSGRATEALGGADEPARSGGEDRGHGASSSGPWPRRRPRSTTRRAALEGARRELALIDAQLADLDGGTTDAES